MSAVAVLARLRSGGTCNRPLHAYVCAQTYLSYSYEQHLRNIHNIEHQELWLPQKLAPGYHRPSRLVVVHTTSQRL